MTSFPGGLARPRIPTTSRALSMAGLAAGLVGLLAQTGCSVLLKTDQDQCTVDADCAARGAAFAGTVCTANVCVPPADPKWGCIGHVSAPVGGGMVAYKAQLLDLISNSPITTGLTVALCNKYDPECATPIAMLIPDATGFVSTTVASDFAGYLNVTDSKGQYLSALLFMDLVAGPSNTDILLIPLSAETGLAQNAGVTVDQSAGLLLVRTADCTGMRTAGVSVSISPLGQATPFYIINNALVPTATQTDSSGNAGFVNVPVNVTGGDVDGGGDGDAGADGGGAAASATITVTGTVGPGGMELGKVTTLVRAGTMTYQILRPTPTL